MKHWKPLLVLFAILTAAAAPPESPPQWPPAPAQARLRFITSIKGPKVAGVGRFGGFLRKLIGLTKAGEIRRDRLIQPTGVFVSGDFVYIADPGARRILRYDQSDGKGVWWPRSRGAELQSPVSVVGSSDGRFFVVDSGLRKVFILDSMGKISGELEGDPEGFGRPAAVAVSNRHIFVSDVANHRIAVFGIEGTFLHAFGRRGTKSGEFNFPTYLWFDQKANQLWVNDSGNFRVQIFTPEGKFEGELGSNGNRPGYLARPRGLAKDSDGHVYISDAAFDAVQIFSEKNRLLLFVGQAGGRPGEFSMPGGIFIDGRDRVYVADTYNRRVQVFQYLKEARP